MKKLVFAIVMGILWLGLVTPGAAQIQMPQPSPSSKITQNVGLMEVTLEYSRPGMDGRQIFGGLVPYDKLWRTGANSPTRLSFSDEVSFNGQKVPAGKYALMTIPGQSEWTIILNKDAKGNGVFSYEESEDVVRVKAKPQTLATPVETFSIQFVNVQDGGAELELSWDKTVVRVPFQTEFDTKVTAQIERALNPNRDAGLYFQVASYYYQQNKNMPQALDLITKSVDMDAKYWTVHLKAKIQARMNDKAGALATAQKSLEMAKTANNPDYVRLNEQLMAELNQ
ncbi:MAG: DUF2911 domain-containing protein [Bacteroidia bacterium]|nr:DUF2911 domain-containing protein [Bacteroidia bacterium]